MFILLNKTISFYICNYICSRPFEIFLRHIWGVFCAQLSALRQASVQVVSLNPKVFLLQQILVSPTLKKIQQKNQKTSYSVFHPCDLHQGTKKEYRLLEWGYLPVILKYNIRMSYIIWKPIYSAVENTEFPLGNTWKYLLPYPRKSYMCFLLHCSSSVKAKIECAFGQLLNT